MHKLNDHVIYRKNGICRIVDICTQNFGGQGSKYYFVLQSVYDSNMRVFVPQGSELEKEMRHVLSAEEIHSTIKLSRDIEIVLESDNKKRSAAFEEIINGSDRARLLCLIKTLSSHKADLESQKKKIKATDAKYLSLAENVISGEFAFSLNIDRKEVIPYINNYLEKCN